MTVLVGFLCRDGVVIGSDSSSTFFTGSHPTIEHKNCKKTHTVGANILFAGTGAVGQAQRFEVVLSEFDKKHNLRKNAMTAVEIGKQIAHYSIEDFRFTSSPANSFGALVAYTGINRSFGLIEFACDGFQPETKTEDMWFVSMGSGQMIVDPFLALLNRTLFKDSQPTVSEGVFAAVWALQHAIELNTGGIDGPMQIGTIKLDSTEKFMEATLLSPETLEEHQTNVDAMSAYIGEYRNRLHEALPGQLDPPTPPQ